MTGSVNKVTLIGNIGNDPEIRTMQSGDKVCNLSIATSESWKDKTTGERKEKTEWHRVVIFGNLVNVCENYLTKGSKVYIEGKLVTRSWDQDGQKKYATEVVLQGFNSTLVMLDRTGDSQQSQKDQANKNDYQNDDLEDEIPF